MFSEEDKQAIQEIVKIVHIDIKYINMDYVYSELEKQFQQPEFSKYMKYIKEENEDDEDDEDDSRSDNSGDNNKQQEDDLYDIIEDYKMNLVNILMCNIFIEKDLSNTYEEVIEELEGWLIAREG